MFRTQFAMCSPPGLQVKLRETSPRKTVPVFRKRGLARTVPHATWLDHLGSSLCCSTFERLCVTSCVCVLRDKVVTMCVTKLCVCVLYKVLVWKKVFCVWQSCVCVCCVCVTKLCVCERKIVCDKLCVCVTKFLCERWCVRKIVCDKLCVCVKDCVCVTKLCVCDKDCAWQSGGGGGGADGGIQNQKREPHRKMWRTMVNSDFFLVSLGQFSYVLPVLFVQFGVCHPIFWQ